MAKRAARCPRVAIVGSGIAGLAAAIGLQDECETVLYEAGPQLGGHIVPHRVTRGDGSPAAVDTGFVVFVPQTYPALTALLHSLGVAHGPARTPFRITDADRSLSFEAAELMRLCGTAIPRTCRRELLQLYRVLQRVRKDGLDFVPNVTVRKWVADLGFQPETIELGVLPWVASFWGMRPDTVLQVSARVALREIARNSGPHGMHRIMPSTQDYLDAVVAAVEPTKARFERVTEVQLSPGPRVVTDVGTEAFEHVVIAVDAIDAATLLRDAPAHITGFLQGFDYVPTVAIVHHDTRVLPDDKSHWRTFHHRRQSTQTGVGTTTTWVFDLLHEWTEDPTTIERPTLLTTGEQCLAIEQTLDPALVDHVYRHRHLVATPQVVDSLPAANALDQQQPFTLAGSYLGLGALHEDALVSGTRAADKVRQKLGLGPYDGPWRHREPATPAISP